MRRFPSLARFGLLLSSAALASGACGSDRADFEEPPKAPELESNVDTGAPGCEPKLRCSGDLKRVLRVECDGTETVEQVCGPELGCGDGACVEACKSAELSKGSIGCAFATLPPDSVIENANGSCFATTIANVWDRPVTVRAELGGEPIDIGRSIYYVERNGSTLAYERVEGPIAPGRVAIVFLANADTNGAVPCPQTVTPALAEDPIIHGTGRTRAFLLTTDAPVSAYSIWPYGGANGHFPAATLLLPSSAWDTHYIAVNPWTTGNNAYSSKLGSLFLQIVAKEDGTEVTMRPNVNILSGGDVEAVPRGTAHTFQLRAGEVLQINQRDDPSGSPIESNKPIGLFGGSECTMMPLGELACDVTGQQTPAVPQWGSEYALVPYRPRNDFGVGMTTARENVPWRLVGAADGTKLTYDPVRPGSAPETLEAGQVATFTTNQLLSVRSQDAEHPFHAAMHMTGLTAVPGGLGDPEFVNVVPSEQFLNRYIFFADYTYQDTTLSIVRRRTPTGFKPVTLDCAGELTGWEPLDKSGTHEFVWVYLTKQNAPVDYPGGKCSHGRHEAYSDGPFSVHVWGLSAYASYGYAAGQGSRSLHNVKGPPVN